jgi:dihydrofolate reductase
LVRASLGVSLDGYIADADGGVEWLNPFFSPEIDFAGFMATIGATLMGRKTYDAALKLGMPPGSSDSTIIVLSRRPLRSPAKGFEGFSGDLGKLVDRLRRKLAGTGQDIWHMGGGESIDAFRRAGLIDRFELSVMPVLLGKGIPMFPPHSRGLEGLKLVHSKTLTNGIVELHYEPIPSRR